RALCDRHNALLIFDEIQTGVGRTGELYAYMHYGVSPDVLTSAKALGGGFPIGAMLTTTKYASALSVGSHGTTFGGNPLACAVAGTVLSLINQPTLLAGVKARHQWFIDELAEINARHNVFAEIRGRGLLIGCVLNAQYAGKSKEIVQAAAQYGLIALIAGPDVVRFAPSLIISPKEIKEGLARLAMGIEQVCQKVTS
ncbi:aminotransferase class III-fold pyridoxal phosphate-dependent enzyme, partial [Yersinia pestis]